MCLFQIRGSKMEQEQGPTKAQCCHRGTKVNGQRKQNAVIALRVYPRTRLGGAPETETKTLW
jgi:hypothetical protein